MRRLGLSTRNSYNLKNHGYGHVNYIYELWLPVVRSKLVRVVLNRYQATDEIFQIDDVRVIAMPIYIDGK